ncbi:hypothetical protein [Cryobacterium zhongshanensis]|uniref:Uncharacterized protein n=1 Tax=Cryobacterium zhongshanensis TaxID=2928153 RepID=A0AA41QUN4_9MICO|nr:hypothetical protein [Cryobacterium zhongshanensis]MCI4657327.1 hypothetical protein [Cryobacterium zhongshanensis]
MGYGAGVNLFLFIASLISWMVMRGVSPGMNAVGTLFVTGFGVLTIVFFLRHVYRSVMPREPVGPYLIMAAVTCAIAVALNSWAMAGSQAAADTKAEAAGTVKTWLTGNTSGDSHYLGKWSASKSVDITTDEFPQTRVTLSLTLDSSRPDLDVILVLNSGTEVLCESEKAVNWARTNYGLKVEAPCDMVVPLEDLNHLRRVTIAESTRVGR